MRLAVPFDHGQIYGHFGRTAQFKLYDVTDGRIVSTAIVDTMGNGHGALTGFLKAYAVDALICGAVSDINWLELPADTLSEVEQQTGSKVEDCRIAVTGVCADCAKKDAH